MCSLCLQEGILNKLQSSVESEEQIWQQRLHAAEEESRNVKEELSRLKEEQSQQQDSSSQLKEKIQTLEDRLSSIESEKESLRSQLNEVSQWDDTTIFVALVDTECDLYGNSLFHIFCFMYALS